MVTTHKVTVDHELVKGESIAAKGLFDRHLTHRT